MKTFKQFLTEANNKDKYTILNDYNSKNKRYWYIVDKKGDPIYDDDGNNIHFNSFNKAKEYVDEYLTEETETKEQLNEAWLPKETSLALSFDNTGNDYLDNNYEISFFKVTSEMIDLMIKKMKKEDPKEWVYVSGCENEKEAKEEIGWIIKTLNEWMKFKLEEESLLQDISIEIEMKGRSYFDHDEFVKNIKMYLKNFGK